MVIQLLNSVWPCDPMDWSRLLCPGGFSRQEHWSGLPRPRPGDLLNPGIEPTSLMSPALADRFFITSTTWEVPPPPPRACHTAQQKKKKNRMKTMIPETLPLFTLSVRVHRYSKTGKAMRCSYWKGADTITRWHNCLPKKLLKGTKKKTRILLGTSLVVRWMRICLLREGTLIQSLVEEDLTGRWAAKPMSHNYWTHARQLLKPAWLETELCRKRGHRSEKPGHCSEEQLQLTATR